MIKKFFCDEGQVFILRQNLPCLHDGMAIAEFRNLIINLLSNINGHENFCIYSFSDSKNFSFHFGRLVTSKTFF